MTNPPEDTDFQIPPPPADWLQGREWETDNFAHLETNNYKTEDDIQGQGNTNRFVANKSIGFWIPIFISIICLIGIATIFTYAYHMLTPECMHYLSDEHIDKLQSIIFNGAVGGIVSIFIKSYFMNSRS